MYIYVYCGCIYNNEWKYYMFLLIDNKMWCIYKMEFYLYVIKWDGEIYRKVNKIIKYIECNKLDLER